MIEGAGEADLAMILERQLGRPARGVVDVSVWCPHGAPAVDRDLPLSGHG